MNNINADLQANKTLLSTGITTAQISANDADSTAHTALAAAGNAQITADNNAKILLSWQIKHVSIAG